MALKTPSDEFYRKTITMYSYLNSETYPKYDSLYNKIMEVLKDITQFSSRVTNEVVNPSKDKLAMYRLNN